MMRKKANEQYDSPDRLNVIVEGSKVIGDIFTESNLRIDGEVLGNVSSASKVVVGLTGIITGNLNCADAEVEGKIQGILNIEGLLALRSNAKIEGDITTTKFQVEEGAEFSGTCKMRNFSSKKVARIEAEVQEDIIY